MQAQPYLVVEGTVSATRRVDVPADSGTRQDGSEWSRNAYAYHEVAILTGAVLDGEEGPDAILTVRLRHDEALPAKGDQVAYAVTARIVKSFIAGRYVQWVVYDRVLQLEAAEAVTAASKPLAAAKTA